MPLAAKSTKSRMYSGDLTSGSLKVACGIIAIGDEYFIADATIKRLVQWDRRTHELLLNFAEPLKTRLKFKMVVAVTFGDCTNNGNVVPFWANIMS
jgi:hypothetical protein